MPAQQTDGGEPEALARRGQCVEMVGVSTAQADDALGAVLIGGFQVFDEFEPLVAADQRVDLVQTQAGDIDAGRGEPVEVKELEGGLGEPVCWRGKH